jgi:16S rRNA pseudouridine516 synthase
MNMPKRFRLDRILSERGYCSRSQADDLIRQRDVQFEGRRIVRADDYVDGTGVTIDGQPLDPGSLLILMHKPAGLTCAHEDRGPLVYDLFPSRWILRRPPLSTVGRLDKDTTGVLLLTDDGQLLHRLTSPKNHVPRTYHVTLRDPLKGTEAARFASGTMTLDDDPKPLKPAQLDVISPTECLLVLHEGRYHQVKRMFEATGNLVTQLHRERFGSITVGGLKPGEWRDITPAERQSLGLPPA